MPANSRWDLIRRLKFKQLFSTANSWMILEEQLECVKMTNNNYSV